MSEAKLALLADRGIISVSGGDARKLLQGILTNDVDLLDGQRAILAGLLSPQGKILFDFLVVAAGDRLLLDVAAGSVPDLVKRLTMYRLRAKVGIEDVSEIQAVAVAWPANAAIELPACAIVYADPRSPALGKRMIVANQDMDLIRKLMVSAGSEAADYHAHRVACGIPEGGKDYDFGDTFPHEAGFDLLGGVAFDKGCYVGQEIVSRMQHRATVRKRVVRVSGAADLPPSRPEIKVGDAVIGRLGSVAGASGLALLRLDRAIEAIDRGAPITADGIALTVEAEALVRHRAAMLERAGQP